ncbi:carbon monoxide dehydrogenase subunit G [Streptomyces sp. TRM S81-3]|uniref:Carbon monoxide dehydrogenase subunit G n=1 Tax=Streptomyces griseicoloratus TaxID=2752516 RepID=A0A926L801_9ACTN|nr:SRPBCC domain-containing protein [Streptomyces griseicoloratus]MBD0424335.1 carbon monoxide dehydrogenase subunit G [Streptomyces griseicoloratus]
MEHEVFVPVPAERLKDVLADPVRVARAVPGLQQDAGAEPVAGRLKVRIGSHSITYRGALRLSARDDGTYAVEGDATEARGNGTVRLELTLRLAGAEGGSTLIFAGTARADGRVTELPADTVESATTRLLNRFAENLGTAAEEHAPTAESLATEDFEPAAAGDFDAGPDADDAPVPPAPPAPPAPPEPAADEPPGRASVFDTEIPPSSLDPSADEADLAGTAQPPAEAAHARRTMIGRSAEEVDHAPPRGRYAPVPAPQANASGTPLRWAAPAAALAVASAIVVGRALRRRR